MALSLVAMFFAGLFLANGVPHFVKGVTGQRHMTTFARSSSAMTNVLRAAAIFVVGGVLLWLGLEQDAPGVAQVAAAGGAAQIKTSDSASGFSGLGIMVLGLIAMFFAGLFLTNGVPHFVKGVTGQRHMTPFARSSPAVVNVLWAAANFVVGGVLLWSGLEQDAPGLAQAAAAGVAALLISVRLSIMWSNPDARLPWHKD